MNDEEKYIGKELGIVSNKIRRNIDKEASKYGLTGVQGKIIGFLYFNSKKRDIFQKDIENDLKIRSSSVTSVLKLMEKNGYIKRINVFNDGRLKKIILTIKGIEIHENVFKVIMEVENKIKNIIKDEETEILINILKKLSKEFSD